jgi:hypothetical protein
MPAWCATTAATAVVPQFTTTASSPTILVTFTNHQQSVGSSINFVIPTTANGVTIIGAYKILTTPTVNTFTIAAATQATANGSFFMNGGQAQLVYQIALGPAAAGTGFGIGAFGAGGFGTGVVPSQQTGTDIAAASWTTDNWGEILIACPINGGIYYWQPGSGFQTASIISTAPPYNAGIFISTTQQILIAYGSSVPVGIGEQQQPLLVQWSDVSNFFQWTASAATQAGNFTIPLGSKLVAGMAVSNQNLLWTDLDLWAMNYVGPPDVYGFTKVGAGMGADFLEHDLAEAVGERGHLRQPGPEAQEAHAATLEAAGLEGDGARGDAAVAAAQRPAGGGAEIKGEDGGPGLLAAAFIPWFIRSLSTALRLFPKAPCSDFTFISCRTPPARRWI